MGNFLDWAMLRAYNIQIRAHIRRSIAALSAKFAVKVHKHNIEDTTGLIKEIKRIKMDILQRAARKHKHTIDDVGNLRDELNQKAYLSHTHSDYAKSSHSHTNYAAKSHTHTGYAATSHSHSEYAQATDVDTVKAILDSFCVETLPVPDINDAFNNNWANAVPVGTVRLYIGEDTTAFFDDAMTEIAIKKGNFYRLKGHCIIGNHNTAIYTWELL